MVVPFGSEETNLAFDDKKLQVIELDLF